MDELEWLLENRHSYLKRKSLNYKAALDSIRSSLQQANDTSVLTLQIRKFLDLLGDCHASAGPTMKYMFQGYGYLPFLVSGTGNRVVAFKQNRSGFLKEGYPFLTKIDGISVEEWLKLASETVPRGSPQLVRTWSIQRLILLPYLRHERGLDASEDIQIEIESENGISKETITMKVANEYPLSVPDKPLRHSQIFSGHIGYLPIPKMYYKQEFTNDLVSYMNQFRDTKALIIDIRGNKGGSRAVLRILFPFFMAPDDPPRVCNIAAYRLGHPQDILELRWLYTENWKGWSAAEREAIKQVNKVFTPEWQPPEEQFSKWHYFVLGPESRVEEAYYYDSPVIILMSSDNFSASDIFLSAFKNWRNCTLIGTPSAGGSGRVQTYRLRNSKIQIKLSSMVSYQSNGKLYDGNGIQPDIYIEPLPTDFIGKTDSVLDKALEIITEKLALNHEIPTG